MRAGRVVLGVGLVTVGVLFLLDRVDAVDAYGIAGSWWPTLVVVLGIWQIAYDRRAVLGGGLIVAIGSVLLAFTTGVVATAVLRIAWPIAIVALGLWILSGRPAPRRRAAGDEIDAFVVFGSQREVFASEGFRGGSGTVLAGQLVLDLTNATPPAGGADLAATVIAGGLDVVVPPGWDVRIAGLPLFGGWDNTTRPLAAEDSPALRIRALVVAGGIEVKYPERWS